MLILIISGLLLVVGIVMIVVGWNSWDALWVGGIVIAIISALICITVGSVAIAVQVTKENDYQSTLYEKQTLVYRLEHKEDNFVGNEMLYSEIVEFNNKLRTHKCYADNLWTGLLFNDRIATIEYIEID